MLTLCVISLSCVVYGPIYGRFMGFYLYKGKPFLMLRNNADPRRCSYFEPGLPVQKTWTEPYTNYSVSDLQKILYFYSRCSVKIATRKL